MNLLLKSTFPNAQNHTIGGCGAAPGPVDPVLCLQKSLVSNCKVDSDCPGGPCPQYGPNPPGVCTRPGDPIFIRGIKCDGPPVTIPCEPVQKLRSDKCSGETSCLGEQKCSPPKCPPVCAIFSPVDKPGECPYVNLAAISCLANSFTTRCSNDKSCPDLITTCKHNTMQKITQVGKQYALHLPNESERKSQGRSFDNSVPSLWNSLPPSLWSVHCLDV
ncbi:unnamed protein product [Mytilus edulis]|uniref:Uncharacterized protein n=1 Tax=Mytilus edulis TaxID=6550 RepID=A0A8S3UW23_MYTED|nr:unnamed protein product [Mytilus edulis]